MGANEYLNLISTIRLDLLELFGSGYVVEHCVSAFVAKKKAEKEKKEREIFNEYVADCLKVITENTAKSVNVGNEANYISNRLADILHPVYIKRMSGDEIAVDIIKRAGLKFSQREEVTA